MRAYRADLTGFHRWLETQASSGALPPSVQMGDAELEAAAATYVTENRSTWAPRTTVRKLAALRSWATWAGHSGFLSRYRPPKPARAVPHPLPGGASDVRAMHMHAIDPRERALVLMCGIMGLRIGEAVKIKPSNFDLQRSLLTIVGKGDKTRIVPVPPGALSDLLPVIAKATLDGDQPLVAPWAERQCFKVLRRLGAKAGVSRRVATHDLRSTALTEAYNRSKNLRTVQELAGHSTSATTEVYTAVTLDAMREAQGDLFS